MWDTGEAVDVTGEAFVGAWRIAVGEEARDGDIDQPLEGGLPLRVRGRFQVTDAGVTSVKVGIEAETVDRATTTLYVYDIPLPAVDTWTDFEGWIYPAASHVFARPYIEVVGSAGEADFGRVDVERAADVAPGKITNGRPVRFGPTTVSNAAGTGVLLASKTFDCSGKQVEIVVSTDVELSGAGNCELYLYIDGAYAGGSSPTGFRRKSIKKTATGSTVRDCWTFHESVGDPDDPGTDPMLTPGPHDFDLYCRNASGAAADFDDGLMQVREFGNDPTS